VKKTGFKICLSSTQPAALHHGAVSAGLRGALRRHGTAGYFERRRGGGLRRVHADHRRGVVADVRRRVVLLGFLLLPHHLHGAQVGLDGPTWPATGEWLSG
jgi:hypothetical protein